MNPMNLLKLEWSKYSPNGTFRATVLLYAGSLAMAYFLVSKVGLNMNFDFNGTAFNPALGLFEYPHNWELLAFIGSWMNVFLLGFLGVFMVTLEFSNRTLRQSVIFGMSRLEVASAKLVWAVALSLAASVFYVLLGGVSEILSGTMLGAPPAGCLAAFFLQALGYLLLGNLVGLLIRQTALATMGYLAYVLFLETACRWVCYFCVAKTRLLLFLPHQVLDALTPFHLPESVNSLIADAHVLSNQLTPAEALVASIFYIGLFAFFFCLKIVKSDL